MALNVQFGGFLEIFSKEGGLNPAGNNTYIHYNFVVAKPLVYITIR